VDKGAFSLIREFERRSLKIIYGAGSERILWIAIAWAARCKYKSYTPLDPPSKKGGILEVHRQAGHSLFLCGCPDTDFFNTLLFQ